MDLAGVIQSEEKCRNLFRHLPKEEIERIGVQRWSKGEVLMAAGGRPDFIYLILDGICVLTKETSVSSYPQRISRLGYLDVIGMYEMIRNIRRVGSVYAYTDCMTAGISGELAEEWIERYPRFMLELCADIYDRYYAEQDYANYYAKYSVDCAVISYLLSEWSLYTRKGTAAQRQVKVGCTRKVISETVGRDLRSVNRTVERLKADGLIRLEKGKICLDRENVSRLEIMRNQEVDGRGL